MMENIHPQYPLNLRGKNLVIAQQVINRLHAIPRTGWVDRQVTDPETVGDHTDELVVLSETLFSISGLNTMCKIHDWPESDDLVGDRRTDNLCPAKDRWTKEQKYIAELQAMQKICSQIKPTGKKILKLWLEYEAQKTRRAKIAYQLDKFQLITKAIEYQNQGQPVIAQEFIDYESHKITSMILRRILKRSLLSLK